MVQRMWRKSAFLLLLYYSWLCPQGGLRQTCVHQCAGTTPGETPFFLLEDLERGASVGKTVLGSPGEETAREGDPFNSACEAV